MGAGRVLLRRAVAIRGCLGKRFAQLLDDPLRRRVSGHVEVQDLAASVFDREEAVERLEGHCRHREEVEGDDRLAVILEKRKPPLTRVATAPNSSQIPGHTPLGDDEAELQKSAMDLGRSPIRVLCCQAPDQTADFIGDLGPAATRAGTPMPVEPENGAVPADDGLGLHHDEGVGPAGPKAAAGRPEESVRRVQYWPRPFPFEDRDLLSEGEDFQGRVASSTEEDADSGQN